MDISATLVAIVFSAISLEAFINEIAGSVVNADAASPPALQLLNHLMRLAGEKASIEEKYQYTSIALTGSPFDAGAAPYQDFQVLIRLRNEIVHYKPERAADDPQGPIIDERKLLTRLNDKKLASLDTQRPLIRRVMTRAVAEWSCKTASAMVYAVCERAVPNYSNNAWHDTYDMYRNAFRFPPESH